MATSQSHLDGLRKRVAKLEKKILRDTAKQQGRLLTIPRKYGFNSPNDFIAAFIAAAELSGKPAAVAGRHPRTKITPAIKAEVKKLAKAGKTGAEIAKAVGISLPSVANIKKELGLVKSRK